MSSPNTPTLSVGAITSSSIALSWNDVATGGQAVNYKVYCIIAENVSGDPITNITEARANGTCMYLNENVSGTSLTITGLTAGTSYGIYLQAYDAADPTLASDFSKEASSTTASSDSSIQSITVDGTNASGSGLSYAITLPSNMATVSITATSNEPNASLLIFDQSMTAVSGGVGSASVTLSVSNGSNSFLIQIVSADGSSSSANTLTITNPAGAVCFLGNAPVATPTGYFRIDSLKEGDLVLTETGKSVAIQRVKVMRVRPGPTTNPYVIAKGQFGATEEILISPRHCVAVGGQMIEARDLGLVQKTMAKPFTYYNIELPGWANMRVAGVEVESLAPAIRVVASAAQVAAAIAKLKEPNTKETAKILQRLCKRNADGTYTVFSASRLE